MLQKVLVIMDVGGGGRGGGGKGGGDEGGHPTWRSLHQEPGWVLRPDAINLLGDFLHMFLSFRRGDDDAIRRIQSYNLVDIAMAAMFNAMDDVPTEAHNYVGKAYNFEEAVSDAMMRTAHPRFFERTSNIDDGGSGGGGGGTSSKVRENNYLLYETIICCVCSHR